MTACDTTYSPLSFYTQIHTHTHTTIDMHPCAHSAINSLPLNCYRSVKCETCFACQFLQLIWVAPVLSPRTVGRDEEGEESGGCKGEVTQDSDTKGHPLSAALCVAARPEWPSNRQAVPTVTAASQAGLIADKSWYLCTPACKPHTDTASLIKPSFQQINNAIIASCNLLRAPFGFQHTRGFLLFHCVFEQPLPRFCPFPHSFSAMGWGVGAGDRNRQVFRCVMFDMLTQHAFITKRRCVWQQQLPDHDYIILVLLVKVRGEPQSLSKAKYFTKTLEPKFSEKAFSSDLIHLLKITSCTDMLHFSVL